MKILSTLAISILLITSALPVFAQGKDFKDKEIKEKSYKGDNLNGADFSEATLDHVDFSNVSAKDAKFNGAQLKTFNASNSDFSGCDFRETKSTGLMSECNFSKTNFEGATIGFSFYNVNFSGASLRNTSGWKRTDLCNFSKADVRGASFRGVYAKLSDTNFRGAIYDNDTTWPDGFDPVAAGAKLATGDDSEKSGGGKSGKLDPAKDFRDKEVKEKTFSGLNLNGADFSEATLDHVDFSNISVKDAKFNGAQCRTVNASNCDFSGSDFRESKSTGLISECNFSKTNFVGATIGFSFYKVNFSGASLRNTSGWKRTDLSNFSGADVRGANFRGVTDKLTDTNFKGATYDNDTSWPEGFDPAAAGAKLAK